MDDEILNFLQKVQEVGTVATQVLIGAPNTIKENIIKQTMDKELKVLEQKLLLMNKNYKLTRSQSKKWITYAVVRITCRDAMGGSRGEETNARHQ